MIHLPAERHAMHNRGGALASSANRDLLQVGEIVGMLGFFCRHRFRMAQSLALAIVIAAMYCVCAPRISQSTAELLVVSKEPLNVGGMPSPSLLGTNAISTHVELIQSPWLAERVLFMSGIRDLATFTESDNPVETLLKSLAAIRQDIDDDAINRTNNILELSFQGRYADECPIIVMAVIDAYRQFLQESNRDEKKDDVTLITRKAEQIRQELANKEKQYKSFREKSPLFLTENRGTELSQQRFANIDISLVSLQIRRAETKARLLALKTAANEGGNGVTLRALLPASYRPGNSSLRDSLLPLMLQQASVSSKYGPDHPEMQAVTEQIKQTRALFALTPPEAGSPNSAHHQSVATVADPVAEYTLSLEQELGSITAAEHLLQQNLETERATARKLAAFELKDDEFRSAIERDQQFHDALMVQLQQVDLDMDSGDFSTTLIAPPSAPEKVAPRTALAFTIAIFLGLALGSFHGLAVEVSQSWAHCSSEFSHSQQLPVLGHIPLATMAAEDDNGSVTGTPVIHPNLFAHRWPDSAVADAYRDLRTAVFLRTFQPGLKVILVTSTNEAEGKSTLGANLAISFAQSGQQVLLIDANLHEPILDNFFGLSHEEGFTSVLNDESELQDAIHATGIQGMSVMPCGRRGPLRPADLLSSPRLRELFNSVRERFDYVLVDSSAMYASTDAHILASCTDGVVLVVPGELAGGTQSLKTIDLLLQARVNVLGIALNNAKPQRSVPLTTGTESTSSGSAATLHAS